MTTTTSTASIQETPRSSDEFWDDEKLLSAPIELLSEFLSALMLRDYETAFTHCKTILHYEPENQTAMEFFPLIQQRLSEVDADANDSSSDEDMKSSYSDDDSWTSSSASSDEYSTADNSLWTTSTVSITDSDSYDKDEKTEELENSQEEGIQKK